MRQREMARRLRVLGFTTRYTPDLRLQVRAGADGDWYTIADVDDLEWFIHERAQGATA